jgi:hypothetical protein
VQESAMMDACVLMVYSEAKDEFNHPVPTWTDGRVLTCGIDMTGGSENRQSNKTIVTWDAMLRLPLRTQFDLRDRVRMVTRFGASTDDNTVYEFAGPAQIGPSGMQVPLKKVEPRIE